jgi:hypothetical protein
VNGNTWSFNPTPGVYNAIPAPAAPVAPGAPAPLRPAYTYFTMPPLISRDRWATWTTPDRSVAIGAQIGPINLVSSGAFRQIAHSLTALLVATLGAMFARHRYRMSGRDRQPVEPVSAAAACARSAD